MGATNRTTAIIREKEIPAGSTNIEGRFMNRFSSPLRAQLFRCTTGHLVCCAAATDTRGRAKRLQHLYRRKASTTEKVENRIIAFG